MTAPATTHEPASAAAPAFALEVRGLVKRYGDVTAVAGLSFAVRAGECFGLLGPNGAGKTTTLEICEGLNSADEGDVIVLGRSWRRDPQWLRDRIGLSLQETQLSEKLSVYETLRLFASFYQKPRMVNDVIPLVGLEEKRDAYVGGLSGGQKQRLAIACALVGDPKLLFLDEPTTGLDPQSRRALWDLVEQYKRDGGTVVLTTHYMDEAERLCDRIAIVDHGKVIAEGTPRALIAGLGADQVVRFQLSDGAAVPSALLESLPGVRVVATSDDGYELQCAAVHETLPALLQLIAQRNARLADLRTHAPTLEDVFVALTGRALRES
ncbi:MAG: ABC transporter ATP-binding protein [Gemmatimonadaceae bacterium]|nr:ABC transporter ATP-binding protein [Gemmatimonadaceae bacterium]